MTKKEKTPETKEQKQKRRKRQAASLEDALNNYYGSEKDIKDQKRCKKNRK